MYIIQKIDAELGTERIDDSSIQSYIPPPDAPRSL